MNKSEIADRMAGRIGLGKSAAREAVDTVFEAIGEALANRGGGADRRVWNLRRQEPSGPYRAQPAHRREPVDTGVEGAGVQAGQGAQGRRE